MKLVGTDKQRDPTSRVSVDCQRDGNGGGTRDGEDGWFNTYLVFRTRVRSRRHVSSPHDLAPDTGGELTLSSGVRDSHFSPLDVFKYPTTPFSRTVGGVLVRSSPHWIEGLYRRRGSLGGPTLGNVVVFPLLRHGY